VDHFLSPILGLVSRAAVIVVIALLCGLAGCGDDEAERQQTEPQRLTAVERAAAASGYDAIRSYCRRLGLHLVAGRAAPGPHAQENAVEGARAIAALARRKPEAAYVRGQSVRQLAGDTAEDLEGTNCSSRLVTELERGL
jgi:hypothetical protein